MNISEALKSVSSYPIPSITLERITIDRGLTLTTEYTLAIGSSESFELAKADVYEFLITAPDIREQEISISLEDRDDFFDWSNAIYKKYGDEKAKEGNTFGHVGDDWNG